MGRRVRVFWPQEREWFQGKIAAFDGKASHHVEYNDGDKEWLNLADQKWELLEDAGGGCGPLLFLERFSKASQNKENNSMNCFWRVGAQRS